MEIYATLMFLMSQVAVLVGIRNNEKSWIGVMLLSILLFLMALPSFSWQGMKLVVVAGLILLSARIIIAAIEILLIDLKTRKLISLLVGKI